MSINKSRNIIILIFVSVAVGVIASLLLNKAQSRFAADPVKKYGYSGDESDLKEMRLAPKKVTELVRDAQDAIAAYKEQFGEDYAAAIRDDMQIYKKRKGSEEYLKQLDYELSIESRRRKALPILQEMQAGAKDMLEKQAQADAMIDSYKEEFKKDYEGALKSDIKEFKKARGEGAFREWFGNEFSKYEDKSGE